MRAPKNPFLKIGEFLTEKLGLDRPEGKNKGLVEELSSLSVGNRYVNKMYFSKKIADSILLMFVMWVICLMIFFTADRKSMVVEDNQLERPGYGMGDREEELTVRVKGDDEPEAEEVTVAVRARKYTDRQVNEILEKGKGELEQHLAGENPSLDEVRTKLNFPTVLESGAVQVEWMTIPYGIVDENGDIVGEPPETGELIELQATLSCQGKELIYETAARVYPPVRSEEEHFLYALKTEVAKAEEEGASREMLKLPETVDGRDVVWLHTGQKIAPLFFFLALVLPLGLWVQRDQRVHERARQRKVQMMLDYSELMWKMTLLLGAGLTIRNAFSKIAAEYKRDYQGEPRYVYEEMLYTCIEMKSGVSESTAYENFGRRCDLPKYIKLGSLLSQNLKKGSKGLALLLEKEAASSMEERKNMAKKLGEQAGTRLIFPMILMFGIVLIILIVPAFLSF